MGGVRGKRQHEGMFRTNTEYAALIIEKGNGDMITTPAHGPSLPHIEEFHPGDAETARKSITTTTAATTTIGSNKISVATTAPTRTTMPTMTTTTPTPTKQRQQEQQRKTVA